MVLKKLHFFADGCAGQNKNSIVAAMLLWFVQRTRNVTKITLYFFKTSHGQNEGDSVHSTVERALKRAGEMYVPSQLVTLISLARSIPYSIKQVQKEDIINFKEYSEQIGVLN